MSLPHAKVVSAVVKFAMYCWRGSIIPVGRLEELYVLSGLGGVGRGTAHDTPGQKDKPSTNGQLNEAACNLI